jgi:hypothetical protein
MPAPDCLLAFIGLSAASLPCFALPTPAEGQTNAAITESATGLYLTTVEGLSLRPAASSTLNGTAATDLWARLSNARLLATQHVRTALEQARQGSYGTPLFTQRGTLGGLGNGQLLPVGTRALMTFHTNARRNGAWRITQLQLYTDQNVADVPLLVDGVQKATITTNGTGMVTLADGGILIPLDGNDHTVEAVLPEGVRVKANKLFCLGCQANTPWGRCVTTNLRNVTSSTSGNGFAVTITEECTEATTDVLCYAVATDNELAQSVGFAIMYKAAELFTDSLLVEKQVSRYTMLEPKELGALAAKYEAKSMEHVKWLSSWAGLGRVRHPCYLCPPNPGPGIMSTI